MIRVIVGLLLVLSIHTVHAADAACPDSKLFSGKLVTDICWSCLFPIRVAGIPFGGGDRPAEASDKIFCGCEGPLGVPRIGFAVGLWEPARIIEIVRSPGCATVLGGERLPIGSRRLLGTSGRGDLDNGEAMFAHYHYYAFPLLLLMDLFFEDRCNADGYMDFDVLYLSEVDPTWSDSEIAFFTNPEAAWLSNPIALSACIADGVSATAGSPQDNLFWCAGTWGFVYPFTGVVHTRGSRAARTSLLATKATAALHRRGLARRTMGDAALCESPIAPFMPKSQYRMTQFYPLPEARRAHAIGESDWRWGQHRSLPGPGEDHVYILWRWHDCCSSF